MKKVMLMSISILALVAISGCSSSSSSAKKTKASSPKTSQVQSSQSAHSSEKSSKNSGASTSKSTDSEASSSTSASDGTVSSGSSSKDNATSSTSSTAVNFDQLSQSSKNKLYAAWLQNAQGQFSMFNVDQNTTYAINEGPNGTKLYKDGKRVGDSYAGISLARERHSAKFIIAGDSISLYVPAGENDYDGNWSNIRWNLQEKLSKEQLIQQYYQKSLQNQQVVSQSQNVPG